MLLSDKSIKELALQGMINPFTPVSVKEVHPFDRAEPFRAMSYGLSAGGYDVSLTNKFKLFTDISATVIDPKRINEDCLVDVDAQTDPNTGETFIIIPPNSYALAATNEYFKIPRDVLVTVVAKSTYARAGIAINVTPIEPGFEGNVVIEIANNTRCPARVYSNEGIAQFLFHRLDQPCEVSYADRGGKYQGQTGLQLGKM